MTEEAFSDLYREYKHRLVRLALWRLHDAHLAEDIAQETLLRAHGLLPASMAENPWPWLKRVAINACEDLRESRREILGKATEEVAGRERADSATSQREAVDAVQRAIEALTPIQKQTIRLSHFEEKSYAEIASIQGIRPEDVRDRLHYSRGKLKTKLRQFADYPTSALIPVFKVRGLWRFKAARAVVKVATIAAVSVTAVGIVGPNHSIPSEAGETKAQTLTPVGSVIRPVEVATSVFKKDVPRGVGHSTDSNSSSTRGLTKPIDVPRAPSPEGSGPASGGSIGPVSLHCNKEGDDPLTQTLCQVIKP